MRNSDTKAALAYHDATKHSAWGVRNNPHRLEWDNMPLPFKIYRGLEPLPLVADFPERDVCLLAALARSAAVPTDAGDTERIPDLSSLSRVLYLAAGITKRKHQPGGEVYFRAYANTGALYHVDVYLAVADLPGLPAGVYHFGPHDFALRRLRVGDWRRVLVEATGANPDVVRAPVILALASTYWRNSWKYQARTWRHCFWDAGTLLANALAAAASEAFEPRLALGFADPPVERLLGLDPQREAALALLTLGRTTRPLPEAAEPAELWLETEPLSTREVDYPSIREAQAASSLADGGEAAAWRGKTPAQQVPASQAPSVPLPRAPEAIRPRESLDQLIRRRGSTRAFDPRLAISVEELSIVLGCATGRLPADFLEPPGTTLLDLYLIVNAVEGIAPGAYYYRRGEHSLECLHAGNFRDVAGHLGLDQQLAADAAVNLYSLVGLPRVLERFGNRGYRAVQLEGGMAGGRMYLAAYAQRIGATGLTFYDDEVTQFFSPHAAGKSVMFLAALGHPDRAALRLAGGV